MVESGRVSGKDKIPASIGKQSKRVSEKSESVGVSKNYHYEYRKRVESVSVLKNGGIRVSTGKR